jgi:hypothetical protein
LNLHKQFSYVNVDDDSVCDICHYARHKKSKFSLSSSRASKCYELFHFDIWGPISTLSVHGHKYFVTAVDDHSRFTWVILCKSKSEVTKLVQIFLLMIENQFDCHVKTVRTDNNGPEFLMPQFYASKGIEHQTSCVETPQQNGRVERKHQHILNVGRALLFQSKLPKQFWSYAILQATYIINRIPSPLLNNKSPYHLRFQHDPDLHELKVFGSLCYASTIQSHRTKLDSRARKSVYLGHKQGVKGAVLLDLTTKTIFISRHMTYHEHVFPYHSHNSSWSYHSTHPIPKPTSDTSLPLADDFDLVTVSTPPHTISSDDSTNPTDTTDPSPNPASSVDNSNLADSVPLETVDQVDSVDHSIVPLGHSTRTRSTPSYLTDFVCNLSLTSS